MISRNELQHAKFHGLEIVKFDRSWYSTKKNTEKIKQNFLNVVNKQPDDFEYNQVFDFVKARFSEFPENQHNEDLFKFLVENVYETEFEHFCSININNMIEDEKILLADNDKSNKMFGMLTKRKLIRIPDCIYVNVSADIIPFYDENDKFDINRSSFSTNTSFNSFFNIYHN